MQPWQNPNGCVNIPVNKRAATGPGSAFRKHSKATQKSPQRATLGTEHKSWRALVKMLNIAVVL